MKTFSKIFIIVIAVWALLIFLHSVGFLKKIESGLVGVLIPPERFVYGLSSNFFSFLSKAGSPKDIANLQEKIKQLTAENAKLKILEEENGILKRALEYKKGIEQEIIFAEVIGRDRQTKTLIIDKGSISGLKSGLPVVSGSGILVGKILNVREKVSSILLITDDRFKVSGAVYGSADSAKSLNNAPPAGIVEGEKGLSLKMTLIPRTTEIKINDLVLTAAAELEMPKGLIIGTVEKVISETRDPFKTAWIKSLTNLNNINFVMIILAK